MSINSTINFLEAKKSHSLLLFGRQLTNTTVMLYGPGQLDSSGVPIPCTGTMRRITVYDTDTVRTIDAHCPVELGDKIAVEAVFDTKSFTVTVLKNQNATELSIQGVSGYQPVWASILIELIDPVIG
jgi:hypothetical protein